MCRGDWQSRSIRGHLLVKCSSLMLAGSQGCLLCDCPGSWCAMAILLSTSHCVLTSVLARGAELLWPLAWAVLPTSTPPTPPPQSWEPTTLVIQVRRSLKELSVPAAPLAWPESLSAIPSRSLPASVCVCP